MREIKFRVFHDGKMYYLDKGSIRMLTFFSDGIPWGLYDSATEQRLVTGDPNAILNTPGVLMQFTGLLDKNKVKIYERDILQATGSLGGGVTNISAKSPLKVYYNQYKWMLITKHGTTFGLGMIASNPNAFEVIGNIHQNPELL